MADPLDIADVVDLAKARQARTPHMEGNARCLACQHAWVAVAPIGTIWLECPSPTCGLVRGRFVAQVESPGEHWHCACGNDLFHWHGTRGLYCPNCGAKQRGHEDNG